MGRFHYHLSELGSRLKTLSREAASPGRILIVDGEGDACRQALADTLPKCHFTLEASPERARQLFLSSHFDLLLLSHSEGRSCLEWLPIFKSLRPSVPVIVTTDCGCEELAAPWRRHCWDFALDRNRVPRKPLLIMRKRRRMFDRALAIKPDLVPAIRLKRQITTVSVPPAAVNQ